MANKRKYYSQQPESPVTPDILPNNSPEMVNAAEALTQLYTTSPNQSGVTSPATTPFNDSYDGRSDFTHPLVSTVNKLTEHPIISNAVKYYESTKKSFGPFNCAAKFVEKSAKPVVNKIETNLNSRYQQRILSENIQEINNKKRKINHEETKKRIQFCLHILRLANDNINSHINELTELVDEQQIKAHQEKQQELQQKQQLQVKQDLKQESNHDLNQFQNDQNNQNNQNNHSQPQNVHQDVDMDTLKNQENEIEPDKLVESKVEIVTTVKKIIHLISNFKPSSLSIDQENLKTSIRQIILNLPSQLNGQDNDKVFVFAKESLDMIGKLTNVFNEQLNKVEDWIGLEKEDHDNDLTAVNSNSSIDDRNGNNYHIGSNGSSNNNSNIIPKSNEYNKSLNKNSSQSQSNEKNDRISIDMLTD